MQFFISVITSQGEYAHAIEASNMTSASLAAAALHTDAITTSRLLRPVLVAEDGRVAALGTEITSFNGDSWFVEGYELPRHEGSTGRINVRRLCTGCADNGEHQHWCSGEAHRGFFPAVFDLSWVGLELTRVRNQRAVYSKQS